MTTRYIGLDLHATYSLFDILDETGEEIGYSQVPTSEAQLRQTVQMIPADRKLLILEQSTLSTRMAQALRPAVDVLRVCNPRENRPISGAVAKNDRADAWRLARQLYKDEQLPSVYVPASQDRQVFRKLFRYYQQARAQGTTMKNRLTSWLRHWGADIPAGAGFSHTKCARWLTQVVPAIHPALAAYQAHLQQHEAYTTQCWERVETAGADYPEIQQFQKIPGCGPVRSHGLSALLMNPWRFPTASALYAYCNLAVRKHHSAGRPVRREQLHRAGHSQIKALLDGIFHSAVRQSATDNEVRRFYQASLDRSRSADNARLNTVRKL